MRRIGAEDIRTLRAVAGMRGDTDMVRTCDIALDIADDSPEGYAAWDTCERVIRANEAQS